MKRSIQLGRDESRALLILLTRTALKALVRADIKALLLTTLNDFFTFEFARNFFLLGQSR